MSNYEEISKTQSDRISSQGRRIAELDDEVKSLEGEVCGLKLMRDLDAGFMREQERELEVVKEENKVLRTRLRDLSETARWFADAGANERRDEGGV
jgi:hypothetical protein